MSNRGMTAVLLLTCALTLANSIVMGYFVVAYMPAREARDLEMARLLERATRVFEFRGDSYAGTR